MDGAMNQKGSGVGLVFILPKKLIIEKSLRLDFRSRTIKPSTKNYWKECLWFKEWGENRLKWSQIQGWSLAK